MSSTFLEVTRATHEEVERLERLIVKDLQREPASGKERLHQNHRVRNMVDQIISNTQKLIEIYEDRDGSRKDEIAALGGNFPGSNSSSSSGSHNVFGAFYDRLKEIRDYHRRHPNARAVDFEDPEEILKEEPFIEFSGEEAFGRYLDLHEIYYEYVNTKFGRVVDYAGFLEEFPKTQNVDREKKLGKEYGDYLGHLLEYLVYFFERTQPLKDLGKIFGKVESDFEERWGKGLVEGWEDKGFGRKGEQDSGSEAIDLQYYDSVEDLMVLGPERLKEGLAALGLKSGGTLQQRAERLFLTKETPLEKLDRKHFAKGKNPPHVGRSQEELQGFKEVALMEAKMKYLVQELLHETLEETKANVEKKQALTYEEMEAEREEEEIQADTESDEEDQQIYNPLKLPLGFDGKPIPYWLYKLHGLGQEFKCEICGNHSYWGRRAFEKHFKEWRHQHGMKCLGIPNTKNFNEITSISEAKALWERIQDRQGLNKWRPDLQEEYEDQEGNVYNKKTYTDLQRQGLI